MKRLGSTGRAMPGFLGPAPSRLIPCGDKAFRKAFSRLLNNQRQHYWGSPRTAMLAMQRYHQIQ